MRIIGGRLKGKTILPPQGYKARPTTDFAKEGLFNVLNNEYEMEGLQVLDLFGGTGAISYEFASRGASMVYCVEMLPLHANFIKSQAAKFGMNNLTVVRHNVFEFLEICHEKCDIIVADPPYALDDLPTLPDMPTVPYLSLFMQPVRLLRHNTSLTMHKFAFSLSANSISTTQPSVCWGYVHRWRN